MCLSISEIQMWVLTRPLPYIKPQSLPAGALASEADAEVGRAWSEARRRWGWEITPRKGTVGFALWCHDHDRTQAWCFLCCTFIPICPIRFGAESPPQAPAICARCGTTLLAGRILISIDL